MKFYGVKRKIYEEKSRYYITRMNSFFWQYMTNNKQKRKRRKLIHNSKFGEDLKFRNKDLSIPIGKYYTPVCIITSDLVPRENIPELQNGLIKLLKKHSSHKYLETYLNEETIGQIERMDNILSSWYETINVGTFDFKKGSILNDAISYFEVSIKNINSSFLLLEFRLYLSDSFKKTQMDLINSNYIAERGYITSGFTHKYKKSGGKRIYTVKHYNNAHLKSDMISENFTILKYQFYENMRKYFSTLLHQKKVAPPSVYVYKTNISYTEREAKYFWYGVGISNYNGQFIDESRKIFFKIDGSGRYEENHLKDMIYIVNEKTVERSDMYPNIDFQIVEEYVDNLGLSVFKFAILDMLNDLIAKECVIYKSKLNKIKLRKNRLRKMLKLRYLYEKDIDFYRRYVSDDIWERAEGEIATVFDRNHLKNFYDYRILTEYPIICKEKILKQFQALKAEFDDKTSILQHLAAYKNESKIRQTNYIMLLLSFMTVVFIVFPDLSKRAAEYLLIPWNVIIYILDAIIDFIISFAIR